MMKVLWLLVMTLVTASADELATAKAEYAKQDKALNAVYGRLKKELDSGDFTKVQESQREWIEFKDYMADWQAYGEQIESSAERWSMAAGLTESRIEWLAAWLIQDQRRGWEGKYEDSYGGHLQIAEQGGKYWFYLEVVRGPTFHLGEIGGEFRVKGGTGWFELKEEHEDESTWLTFLHADDGSGRVKVIGENTQMHHGARAYFDGNFLWMGELSAKEKSDVIESKNSLED